MERPVSFTNAQGLVLHGILHLPTPRTHIPLGVVLLSPGQKCRLGPWRAYVTLARRIANDGVPVLRFDYHGLGDSEGSLTHGQDLVDLNGFVQTGGLSADVASATDFFAREAGVRRFVFAGLCGGASTGLIASAHIRGVYGQILIDLPVTVSNSARQRYLEQNAAELLRLRPQESHGVLRSYLEKIGDTGAWRRLLTGKSDYGLLVEAVKRVLANSARAAVSRLPFGVGASIATRLDAPAALATPRAARDAAAAKPFGADEVINQQIVDAFTGARAQGQKLFFLNSSAYHPMFQTYFGSRHLPADRAEWRGMGLLVVPETNHVFSADHGQQALFETVTEFVRNALAELAERPSMNRISQPMSTFR